MLSYLEDIQFDFQSVKLSLSSLGWKASILNSK